jgi:hypothetical protein
VKLTAHDHVVPILRMSGANTLLLLYAFMAWEGETLPLPYVYQYVTHFDQNNDPAV